MTISKSQANQAERAADHAAADQMPATVEPRAAAPNDPAALRKEIEEAREHLAEAVEELAAKFDVKARAKARTAALTQQVGGAAGTVRGRASDTAMTARRQAAKLAQSVPQQTRRMATTGIAATRERRVQLAVIGGAGLILAISAIIRRRRANDP
jgi:Protein of unknown function (DUF3618)